MPLIASRAGGSAGGFGGLRTFGAAGPVLTVTGMSIWLDADDPTTLTAGTGNGISGWADKSTNAYSFTQNTALKQPQTGTRTRNGRNVIDFDGGFGDKQALNITAANSAHKFTTDGDASFFIACLTDAVPSPGVMMTNNAFGSPGVGFFWNIGTAGRLAWDLYRGVGGTQVVGAGFNEPTSNVSTFIIGSVLTDPANGTAANRSFVRINKGTVHNLNTSSGTVSASDPSSTLTVGGSAGAPSNGDYFNGVIGEIIMYPTKLSDTDRDLVIDYLMAKWDV